MQIRIYKISQSPSAQQGTTGKSDSWDRDNHLSPELSPCELFDIKGLVLNAWT